MPCATIFEAFAVVLFYGVWAVRGKRQSPPPTLLCTVYHNAALCGMEHQLCALHCKDDDKKYSGTQYGDQ